MLYDQKVRKKKKMKRDMSNGIDLIFRLKSVSLFIERRFRYDNS